jgi:Cof subfamily protein (haloacid dehalogenase superfamily)
MAFERPPRILALDLDGTLITDYGNWRAPVSRENLDALADLRAAGTRVVISTGRSVSSTRSILERTGDAALLACDLITHSGAAILDAGGTLLATHPLPRAEAALLLAIYREHGLDPILFESVARGGACLYERDPANPRMARYLTARAREEGDGGLLRRVARLEDHLDEDPLSLGTIDTAGKLDLAYDAMTALDLPGSRIALQNLVSLEGETLHFFLEAFARDASKGAAFREYCALEGYAIDRAAAIGDGHNDLGLLEAVGFGIAMGNAPDELKAVADHVAPDFDRNGVAAAIRACLLP